MTPMQQILLGVGAKKKTYMDDVFSIYLWTGNGNDRTITNGIDLKGEGGMVWVKDRGDTSSHIIADTARDDPSLTGQKYLSSNDTDAETSDTNGIKYFYNTGFSTGSGGHVNASSSPYSSYSFRKAPGFFDVIKYTGTGSVRTIAHSLGSKPGMIWVKRVDSADSWFVYHKTLGATKKLYLNDNSVPDTTNSCWDNTEPTSSVFTVGTDGGVNGSGGTYVAYVFAGGGSTVATARSVKFDGTNDHLVVPDSTDFDVGSGDFTIEYWAKGTNPGSSAGTVGQSVGAASTDYGHLSSWQLYSNTSNELQLYVNYDASGSGWSNYCTTTGVNVNDGQWHHYAAVRDGTMAYIYVDGVARASMTLGSNALQNSSRDVMIGRQPAQDASAGAYFKGEISNVRVVKGTAVYTSAFRPLREPLTNISNTKLLCCNDSSVTAATVIPTGSITNSGGATASTDSPFDDLGNFVLGDNEDENTMKVGSYLGNNNANGPEIFLGWEPQWVLLKRVDQTAEDWTLYDSMRGIATGYNDMQYKPNYNYAETTSVDRFSLTSTGFKITSTDSDCNANGIEYIYACIRRPDGYIGKPVSAGTDVFGLTTGAGSTSRPSFVPNFVVDFNMFRKPGESGQNWQTSTRLMGTRVVYTDLSNAEQGHNDYVWDSNVGVFKDAGSDYQAWSWKRHAGFDVITWVGQGGNRAMPHSLNQVPEMIWVKRRDDAHAWAVYHKGLNGGTNPWNYNVHLNNNTAETADQTMWNNTAPTSAHFTISSNSDVNANGTHTKYIAMLFSSVNGVSKVGSYVGSNSEQTITLGFEPRFLIFKNIDTTNWWEIRDTGIGWATSSGGTSQAIYPSETNAKGNDTAIHKTSTGFVMAGNIAGSNQSGSNYIYYAHA